MNAKVAEAPKYAKDLKKVPPKVQADTFNYPRKNTKKAGRILFIRPASLL